MHYAIPNNSGIYGFFCLADCSVYIGSSVDLFARFKDHAYQLKRGAHCCDGLQQRYDQFGADTIEFSVIEHCTENLFDRELFWTLQFRDNKAMTLLNCRKAPTTSKHRGTVKPFTHESIKTRK